MLTYNYFPFLVENKSISTASGEYMNILDPPMLIKSKTASAVLS